MKLTSIQVLRGIAAFAVLMSHIFAVELASIQAAEGTESALLSSVWEKGFAGVDLFFVISGFIMVYVTAGRERGAASAADFILARASRIYPLWWLFMGILGSYLFLVYGTPGDPEQFELSGNSAPVYLLNSIFLLPQGGHPTLGVGWTLVHEMYFYTVFAAFLFAPQRWLPGLLAIWAVFVLGCDLAGWTNYFPTNYFELANYPMTIEFIAGAFVALLAMSGRRAFAAPLTLIGAVTFIAAMIIFSNDEPTYTLRWGRVIWFGLPATILVYGIASWEADGGLERVNWSAKFRSLSSWLWNCLVKLGDVSFALYLCHMIVIGGVRQSMAACARLLEGAGAPALLYEAFLIGAPGRLDNITFVALSISASIVVALISYQFFERPSLSILAKWRKNLIRPISSPKRGEMIRDSIW